jgi:purine-cytosine permease-like protein
MQWGVLHVSMSGDLRRRQRTRGWAIYGVTIVTVMVTILVIQLVGHDAAHLVSRITQGLTR